MAAAQPDGPPVPPRATAREPASRSQGMNRRRRPLRLAPRSGLLTADAFEDLLNAYLAPRLGMARTDGSAWVRDLLGPPDARRTRGGRAARLTELTGGVDLLVPGYDQIRAVSAIAEARNAARSPVRLLVIAHSPGTLVPELLVLSRLLVHGDLVVCPSRSAAALIRGLIPAMGAHLRVVPHPVEPADDAASPPAGHSLTTLCRVVPGKLIHRAVDAIAILRDGGLRVKLTVPGAAETPLGVAVPQGVGPPGAGCGGTAGADPGYLRCLAARIDRLGLGDLVELTGAVRPGPQRTHLLARSSALVNLSVAAEESFGKAVVEALAAGRPSVVTGWDGLPETAGAAGRVVPVHLDLDGGADVLASDVAEAISALLVRPPDLDECRRHAARSDPAAVGEAYLELYGEAVRAAADGTHGPVSADLARLPLVAPTDPLGCVPALAALSWREAFDGLLDEAPTDREDDLDRAWALAVARMSSMPHVVRLLAGGQAATGACDLRQEAGLIGSSGTRDLPVQAGSAGLSGAKERRMQARPAGELPAILAQRPVGEADVNVEFPVRLAIRACSSGADLSGAIVAVEALIGRGDVDLADEVMQCLRVSNAGAAAVEHLDRELALWTGQRPGSCGDAQALEESRSLVAGLPPAPAARRLRQLAKAARHAGRPQVAIGALLGWLRRFPDEPESASVWAALRVVAAAGGPRYADVAEESAYRLDRLLPDGPIRMVFGPDRPADGAGEPPPHAGDPAG